MAAASKTDIDNLTVAISNLSKEFKGYSSKSSGRSKLSGASTGRSRDVKDNYDVGRSTPGAMNSMLDMFRFESQTYQEEMVRLYGGQLDEQLKEFENVASITAKTQMRIIEGHFLDLNKFIGDKSLMTVFGSHQAIYDNLGELYKANSFYLNKLGKDFEDFDAGAKVMTDSLLIKEQLRIDTADFGKIIENELTKSEKAMMQVFKDIAFYSDAYADKTNASIFQISNNMSQAISNVETFGDASTANIGKLAAGLGELRLSTTSVTGLVDKMQSWEGATKLAQELGGAFGAVINPLELMEKAFDDPGAALDMLRDSMLDANASSEELGHAVKFAAQAMGISYNEAKLLLTKTKELDEVWGESSDNIVYNSSRMEEAVKKAGEQMYDPKGPTDILQTAWSAQIESQYGDRMRAFNQARSDMMIKMRQSAGEWGDISQDTISSLNESYIALIDDSNEDKDAALEKFLEGTAGLPESVKSDLERLAKEVASFDFTDIKKSFERAFGPDKDKLEIGKDLDKTFTDAKTMKSMQTFHDVMKSQNYYARQSPSQFHKDMIKNFELLANDPDIKRHLTKFNKDLVKMKKIDKEVEHVVSVKNDKDDNLESAMMDAIKNDLAISLEMLSNDKLDSIIDLLTNLENRPIVVENTISGTVEIDKVSVGNFKKAMAKPDASGDRFVKKSEFIKSGQDKDKA